MDVYDADVSSEESEDEGKSSNKKLSHRTLCHSECEEYAEKIGRIFRKFTYSQAGEDGGLCGHLHSHGSYSLCPEMQQEHSSYKQSGNSDSQELTTGKGETLSRVITLPQPAYESDTDEYLSGGEMPHTNSAPQDDLKIGTIEARF